MQLAFVSALITVYALAPVKAIYFTYPQSNTVWTSTIGQTITWKYQPGDATVGDIVLVSEDGTHSRSVATGVQLQSGSEAMPQKLSLESSTSRYYLRIVNDANPSTIYTSVGPFEIDSFRPAQASPASSTTTTSNPAPSSSTTSPARTTTTTSATSSTTSSSSSTSTSPMSTLTVESTAQAVTLTSTSSNSNAITMVITATASVQSQRTTQSAGMSMAGLRSSGLLACVAAFAIIWL